MMNMNKLSRAGDNIHLSEEAKQRIIDGCNANMPGESGYTDHVMTVERYKPQRAAKLASGLAVCTAVVVGAAVTASMLNRFSEDRDSAVSGPAAQVTESYSGIPVNIDHTPVKFLLESDYDSNSNKPWLSTSQKEQINNILMPLKYTKIPPVSLGDDYDYANSIIKYVVDNNVDTVHWLCFKDDIVLYEYSDSEKLSKECYKLSENVYDQIHNILELHFLFLFDEKFTCEKAENVSLAGIEEMRQFIDERSYTNITGTEGVPDISDDGITFTCQMNNWTLRVDIDKNMVYLNGFVGNDNKRLHLVNSEDDPYYGETYIFNDCDDI
jgi:hypothetical protein